MGSEAAGQDTGDPQGIGGSEYLKAIHGRVAGQPPVLSLALERAVQRAVLQAAQAGMAQSAHDCSDGGLAVALAEMWLAGGSGDGLGLSIDLSAAPPEVRSDFLLFGETASRIVLEVAPEDVPKLQALCQQAGAPVRQIGRVTDRPHLSIHRQDAELVHATRSDAESHWREALACAISG